MNRTIIWLSLALIVMFAGCSTGILQDEGPATTDAGSDDVSTATTATPTWIGPGISESGIENDTALQQANEAALAKTGYVVTARSERRFDTPSGVRIRSARSTIRSGSGTVVHERHVSNKSVRGNTTTEIWSDGSVTLIRDWQNLSSQSAPQVRFRTAPSREDAVVTQSGTAGMYVLLHILQYDVSSRSDGQITLTATGIKQKPLEKHFGEDSTVRELEAELVVDASGRIRTFEGALVVEPGSDTSGPRPAILANYQLETVGDVAVEQPDWIESAREAVPIVDASIEVVEGRYVAVTNEGPDTIPSGINVGLTEGPNGTLTMLEEPVAPGETIYLYRTEDTSGPVIAREKPEEAAMELSGTYTIHVRESLSNVLLEETVTVEGS